MQLAEEDHAHCANRDNSGLIRLQMDSMGTLYGKAPQTNLHLVSPHDGTTWNSAGDK